VFTIGTGTIVAETPIKVTWSAVDAGVGLTETQVQISADGLAFTDLYTGLGTSTTIRLASGHTYRFRVRAIDAEDNVSSYVVSDSRGLVLIAATSPSITYAVGPWGTFRPIGAHSYAYSLTRSDSASYTFTGREIVWVGPLSSKSGLANVYIDGVKVSTVDLYRASGLSGQQLFKKTFATSGTHTIKVVVAEIGKWVGVDEFIVLK